MEKNIEQLLMADACGEATSDERAILDCECAQNPALAERRKRLIAEMEFNDFLFASPEHGLRAKEVAAREAAAKANIVSFPTNAEDVAAARAAGESAKPVKEAARPSWFPRLAAAAAIALFAGIASMQFFGRPNTTEPPLTLRGETAFTRPTFDWDAKEGQLYDVWILPKGADQAKGEVLFVANKKKPPVRFEEFTAKGEQKELKPDTDYIALLCLNEKGMANRLAGTPLPFRVSKEATADIPTPKTADAALSVMRRSVTAGKPGDALGIFATLSDDIKTSPEVAAYAAALREQLRKTKPQN